LTAEEGAMVKTKTHRTREEIQAECMVARASPELCAAAVAATTSIFLDCVDARMSGAVDCYLQMLERVVRKMIATPV
jgi:hypothetical protein